MERPNKNSQMLLVDSAVLPEVFTRVLNAKQLLSSGKAVSAAQAARIAGVSRSAFYKYRDSVFAYDVQQDNRIITIQAELCDRPGILSRMLSAFADTGANILTVNQSIPAQGKAVVSVTARIDKDQFAIMDFINELSSCDGVKRILRVSRQHE